MHSFAKLIFSMAMVLTISGQLRPPRIGRSDNIGSVVDAVATFDGVFKSADKKYVEIQVESGDIMRMYMTHGTKFIRDGKTVKPSDFHEGDKVIVDATRDTRMNLLAVKIQSRMPEEKPTK